MSSNDLANGDLSPTAALQTIGAENAAAESRAAQVQDASRRGEVEAGALQKVIYDNANPSPIFVASVVLVVVFCLYLVYIVFIKPCADGEWVDTVGNKWRLEHNRFSGVMRVHIQGKPAGYGRILDNFVSYGELIGVWDYADTITFTEGWKLQRVV